MKRKGRSRSQPIAGKRPISARRRRELKWIFTVIFAANAIGYARDVPFFSAPEISTGADAVESVTAADVDGDGDIDVLSASNNDDKIAWYENTNGDGSAWTEHTISTAADVAQAVFAADVDGDGDIDALSASFYEDKIAWYENTNGDGSAWTEHTISTAADAARSVYAADVDGDGDIDALSASRLDHKFAWYENTAGDGTAWTEHTISTVAWGAYSVFAADLDGDGDLDTLSASPSDSKLAWYENTNGDGSAWTERTISTAAIDEVSVFAADMDGDGDLDALSASSDDNKIAWYENTNGDGSAWTERTISTAAITAKSVFAADVDGDGDLDALSASQDDDKIAWYENTNGDGTVWSEHTISTAADGAVSVFAADVDGDGDLDALSASHYDDTIAWYENETIHRSAAFGPASEISTAADSPRSIFGADVDGDGDLDALSASRYDNKIAWYENTNGDGSAWTERTISTAASGARSVFAADVDGDGDIDALSASMVVSGFIFSKVAWYENTNGDGSAWTERIIFTNAYSAVSVFAADVDGDGDIDAVSTSVYDDTIAWYENTIGDGSTWTEHTISTSADATWSVVAADVDGDGDIDALPSANLDGKIAWYENTAGDGSAWTERTISTLPHGTFSVYAADIDGDGDVDALCASSFDDQIAWYENTAGDGSAWIERTIATVAAGSVFAADVDSDGDIDALSASSFDDRVAWYENRIGDGTLWIERTISTAAYGAGSVFAADVDGDGDIDALSASRDDDKIAWYENRGGQFALATTDVAQKVVGNSQVEDLLKIEVIHGGRAGDTPLELASLELLLTDGSGTPLSSTQASALFANLEIYLDEGTGAFEEGSDTPVATLTDFSPISSGVLAIPFTDGDANVQVAHGSPKTFFVVATMKADAQSQTPSSFAVEHRTESSSQAEDADHDIPLVMEYAANVATGKIDTALTSASCQAPFDLHLEDRTIATTVTCQAGTVLEAGNGVTVVTPGALTLKAGQSVMLSTGFSVDTGGALSAEIDPALEP